MKAIQKFVGMTKRPIVLVTAGKSGTGKSTLVNNILGLEGDEAAHEDCSPNPVTTKVKKYKKVVNEVTVEIVDTPGFEAGSDSNEEEIVKQMSLITGGKVDFILYCISVVASRFDNAEERIIERLNKAFSNKIWERTILVLTHADNIVLKRGQTYMEAKEKDFQVKFQDVLAQVATGAPRYTIPVVLAGEKLEIPSEWKKSLLRVIVENCNAEAVPALLISQGMELQAIRDHFSDQQYASSASSDSHAGFGTQSGMSAFLARALSALFDTAVARFLCTIIKYALSDKRLL